jgi:hypothetical protein
VLAKLLSFSERPIPNIDYLSLLPLIAARGGEYQDIIGAAAAVVANCMSHANLATVLFQANVIPALIGGYDESDFEGNVHIIRALALSCCYQPQESFQVLLADKGINILLTGLEIEEVQFDALQGLLALSGIAGATGRNSFLDYCEKELSVDVIYRLRGSDDARVKGLARQYFGGNDHILEFRNVCRTENNTIFNETDLLSIPCVFCQLCLEGTIA